MKKCNIQIEEFLKVRFPMESTCEQLKEQIASLKKRIDQLEKQQTRTLGRGGEKYQLLWDTMSQEVIC